MGNDIKANSLVIASTGLRPIDVDAIVAHKSPSFLINNSWELKNSGLENIVFAGSKRLLPGARPDSKTNFVVAKLYVHFLRNENILITYC